MLVGFGAVPPALADYGPTGDDVAFNDTEPSSAAAADAAARSGSSGGRSWTSVFQDAVSSIIGGGARTALSYSKPAARPAPASDGSSSTLLVLGGLAVVGVGAYLVMRHK